MDMDKYIGTWLDDRYEIVAEIGAGGMAVVYKAMCHWLNRYVAVKVLRDELAGNEEFRRRFRTEAQAVAMLSHPNIVSVYDVSKGGAVEYIVMELIEGITLKQYMAHKGRLNWGETIHFSAQIAKALGHAHSKGIIHRDIKPHNVMLLSDGTAKVADFGIARLESETAEPETVGSVHYISPEQARGGNVDGRSDLYSLGIVMYEMLTGRVPYDGDTDVSVAMQHLSATPVLPSLLAPDVPPELERITLKAMAAQPEERYQSAEELLADLEACRQQLTQPEETPAEPLEVPAEEQIPVPVKHRNVRPIAPAGEQSRQAYDRRRARGNLVSLLSGFFLMLAFVLAVFVFLWNYWLKELFSDPERMNVPNFVGSYVEDITDNEAFTSEFNFTSVTYASDPEAPEGLIIRQSPEAGKSMMLVDEGIDVELVVSAGIKMEKIPDVRNADARTAQIELEALGFQVEITEDYSTDITEGYVVSISPNVGESLATGSVVHMTVSLGPETEMVEMPSLIGLSQSAAERRLESAGLVFGSATPVDSNYAEGTVVWQSEDAYSQVEAHTRVFLQVSLGPQEEEEKTDETKGDG